MTVPRWFTLVQAAEYLGVSRATAYRLVATKQVAHVREGAGPIRFLQRHLDDYLAARTVAPTRVEASARATTRTPAGLDALSGIELDDCADLVPLHERRFN